MTDVGATCTGRSNDFDWEEASVSTDAVEPEAAEEFEDVKFEENCLDPEVEKNEVCFISVPERKKTSYRVIFGPFLYNYAQYFSLVE